MKTLILLLSSLCSVASAEIIAVKIANPAVPNPSTCCDYGFYQWNQFIEVSKTNWITLNDGPVLTDGVPSGTVNDYFKIYGVNPSRELIIGEMGRDEGPQHVLYGTLGGEEGLFNPIFTEDGVYTFHVAPYGQGEEGHGEVWILWSVDSNDGDWNNDGVVDQVDIDIVAEEIRGGFPHAKLDFNDDGTVNWDDHQFMIENILGTTYGDANLDTSFNSEDLVTILQAGTYEAGLQAGWDEGDFSGDALFTTDDLMLALQSGNYDGGVTMALPVPETFCPLSLLMLLLWRKYA